VTAHAVIRAFRAALDGPDAPPPGARVVAAVSGGVDSCVLLHLLRFVAPGRFEVVVGHFDHALRADSAEDGLWVRGLARSWGLAFRSERAPEAPRGEEGLREARYAYLERLRSELGAGAVLTAHHADDQAETVLFRLLRGTGPGGLAGIPRSRDGTVFRPLLAVWRDDLLAYATAARVGWRDDPSNAGLGPARNALRHRILPAVERRVAPGARRALVRLAEIAAADEAAWSAVLEPILAGLDVEREGDGDEGGEGVSFDRAAFLSLPEAVRPRVLRALWRPLWRPPAFEATWRAVAFAAEGRSGGAIELGAGIELRRRLGRLVLLRAGPDGEDRSLEIADAGPGAGEAWLGGRRIRVRWGGPELAPPLGGETLEVSAARLPLTLRSRRPGDRIRLAGGTRKLKKVMLEERIPADLRAHMPVLVDARGEVLWVPGVAAAEAARPANGERTVRIGIE